MALLIGLLRLLILLQTPSPAYPSAILQSCSRAQRKQYRSWEWFFFFFPSIRKAEEVCGTWWPRMTWGVGNVSKLVLKIVGWGV